MIRIGSELKLDNFLASNGFQKRFKIRPNIIGQIILRESAGVSKVDWKQKNIIRDYDENINNLDESALFNKCMSIKTLEFIGHDTKKMKIQKERYTFL